MEKNHRNISPNAENEYDKLNTHSRNRKELLSLIRDIYKKLPDNTVLHVEKLNAFSLQ